MLLQWGDGQCTLLVLCSCFLCRCLNACWELLILAGFFLSSWLVAVFLVGLDIAMVVVVVVDKKEREERDDC